MTGHESDKDKSNENTPSRGAKNPANILLKDVALCLERCAAQVQDRAYAVALQRDAAMVARLITLAADLERLALRARRMHEQC